MSIKAITPREEQILKRVIPALFERVGLHQELQGYAKASVMVFRAKFHGLAKAAFESAMASFMTTQDWYFVATYVWVNILNLPPEDFCKSNSSSFVARMREFIAAHSDNVDQSDGVIKVSGTDTGRIISDEVHDEDLHALQLSAALLYQYKEQTMNNTITPFETIHYVFGQDVSKMTADGLLSAVRKVEAEIDSLSNIKSESAYVVKRKDELNVMLKKIVEHLDAKA